MKKIILYIVSEDWYFLSHRLPLALKAKKEGYEVVEMTQFKPGANYAIFKNPGKENPAVYKIEEITID